MMRIGGGVNGHRDICHGGFVGLLLDEYVELCFILFFRSYLAGAETGFKGENGLSRPSSCCSWESGKVY